MLRVRLKYEKRGSIRFASHRDLMRVFRRAFASAEIPVCFSQGFNPHPRFSFGPSLRTGWESDDEYFDALLETPVDEITARCAPVLPEGLRILDSNMVGEGVPKLAADVSGARYEVRVGEADVWGGGPDGSNFFSEVMSEKVPAGTGGASGRTRALEALASAIAERYGRRGPAAEACPAGPPSEGRAGTDGTPPPSTLEVRCAEADGGTDTPVLIEYLSTMHGGKSLFPEDILTPFLGAPAKYATPIRVLRKALYVERGGRYVSPLSRAALETKK